MTTPSQIIEESCCGQGLPIDCPKLKLVEEVEDLEEEIERLNNNLHEMIDLNLKLAEDNERLSRGISPDTIIICLLITTLAVMVFR